MAASALSAARFVAETLMPLILDLEAAYRAAKVDPAYKAELDDLAVHYTGRPSPLYFARRITEHLGGAKVWFKREELNHTGSHKINNCLGQILLAKRMGKTRIIAETGAGQHGVATATVCAKFDLPCTIFMGATDVARQMPNVLRMKMLGAEVRPVTAGAGTLKDAMNEALRDWVTNVDTTYYLIGTAAGPHPYPEMVRDFQSVIGTEIKAQFQELEGKLPDAVVACVGGGSNAIGTFHAFLDDPSVAIYGAEAGGHGIEVENGHAASMTGGRPGVLHGNRTYLLQDGDGQILEGHSISAGLDYPGVGPEHSFLHDSGRVTYAPITDKEALDAFQLCTRLEGIIPALESAHGLAQLMKVAPTMRKDQSIVLCLSGRGDKDVEIGRQISGAALAMRGGLACLVLLAALAPAPAMADWMTFVGRNIDTGERLGLGARVFNEEEDPMLAISCTPDGLTATFDTGFVVPQHQVIDKLPTALLVGADGGPFDPFPISLESFTRGERTEMRLRLDATEAKGLAEYVLGADQTIRVAYRLDGEDVAIDFSNGSAAPTIGAVIDECQGQQAKSK